MSSTLVSVLRDVSATPEQVWKLVTDLPRMGEWSPENRGGTWVKGATGAAVGAHFAGKNKNGKKSWKTKVVVNACDEPRKFSFALTVMGANWCDWIFEIEPTSSGSRVTHSWVDHRKTWQDKLGKLVSGVSDRASHNKANMEVTLEQLAQALNA